MSIPGSASPLFLSAAAAAAPTGYQVDRSLRFDSSSSSYLNRTPSSAGNRKTFTYSVWVKRNNLGTRTALFGVGTAQNDSSYFAIEIESAGDLRVAGWNTLYAQTNDLFRDPSSWYHLVIAVDTTQASAADQIKIYKNGSLVTKATENAITQNTDLPVNSASAHNIGYQPQANQYGDKMFANIEFIDGQALAPTDFGEYDDNNVWQPKEVSVTSPNDGTTWSNSCSGTIYNASLGYANAFDGSLTTYSHAANGNTITFTPSSAIPVSSSVRIFCALGSITGSTGTADVTINGTSYVATANTNRSDGYFTVTGITSITSITWERAADNDLVAVSAIEVDGEILIDGYNNSTGYGTNGFHLPFSDNSSNAALGTDSSGNSNTWTVNNLVAEQPTTLPGVAFDGSGDYLSIPSNSDFAFGTGDFTLEYFINTTDTSFNVMHPDSETGTGYWGHIVQSSSFNWNDAYNASNKWNVNASSILDGKWHHCAICRASGTTKVFFDGVSQSASGGSFSDSTDYNGVDGWEIGGSGNLNDFDGLFSNFRILKGTALYTANFTPPTAPLTNVTNTKLLCCQSSSSATAATVSPGTITANGNAFATVFTDSTSANDSLVDSPTNGTQADTGVGNEVVGNYATLNPLFSDFFSSAPTYSNGNLDLTQSSDRTTFGTIAVSSGKWYWEISIASGTNQLFGITDTSEVVSGTTTYDKAGSYYYYPAVPRKYVNGSFSSYGSTVSVGDVVGIALDLDSGEITCYKNGVSQGVMASSLPTATYVPGFGAGNTTACTQNINFGQRPFAYTAPSGYKALCTTNLPDPTIADGSTVMDVALWTGNGSSQTISSLSFQPEFVWGKRRDSANTHWLMDVVRGAGQRLVSAETSVEDTKTDILSAFTSNGFTVGSNTESNANAGSYVAWTWDGGTSTVSNTDGSITSSVRANASAGFSIVFYTGDGNAATIGHGLNAAPELIIKKFRSSTSSWDVYHASAGAGNRLVLNTTAAVSTTSSYANVNSSTFDVHAGNNDSGVTMIAYCFAPVAGYSAFGSYTGNGSADGPFVYTGFRPAFLLVKASSAAQNWNIFDDKRSSSSGSNVIDYSLSPNLSNAEYQAEPGMDFVSNGFKSRNSVNTNGVTYVWAAFASHPFKTARAA